MNRENLKKVSVIMPCFNDGAYIEDASQTVFQQTYPDVELIIIDDGSDQEETVAAIARLKEKGAVVIKTNHEGPSAARNAGIAVAKGKYILPVDADDRIDPTYIEKAVEIMESDANIGIVYCQADLFGERTGVWALPDYSLENMLLDNVIFVTSMFRKNDWEAIGGYRTSMKYGMEDYDFWLSILELGREVRQIPEILFHYRIKPVSRTTQFQDELKNVQKTYRQLYRQHTVLFERYKDEYAMVLRKALIEHIFQLRQAQMEITSLQEQVYWLQQEKTPTLVRIWRKLKRIAKRILNK